MQWRFDGADPALQTKVGSRDAGAIVTKNAAGCALFGPYLIVPAGRLTARILLAPGARGSVKLEITNNYGKEVITTSEVRLRGRRILEETVELPREVEALEVRLFSRGGSVFAVEGLELDLHREHRWTRPAPDRQVGTESGKTYEDKIESGFLDRYLSGPAVMEVGFKGYDHKTVPIVPQAVGVDVGYPGYDGRKFPFADGSLDAIYSSHCFEHIPDYRAILRDWYRLLKVGGFLIIVVPHQHLFERKRSMPSRWNPDHQRFYTPRSLLAELESALDENSYRIRHLVENDKDFDYRPTPLQGSTGCFEIELVVERISQPHWVLDDGAVRAHPAAEFRYHEKQRQVTPYAAKLDLTEATCLVWGPYSRLVAGLYEVEFFFDLNATPHHSIELVLEVTRDANRLHVMNAHIEGGADLRFILPFEVDRDDAFWEFRVVNPAAQANVELIFRGVELRHARGVE